MWKFIKFMLQVLVLGSVILGIIGIVNFIIEWGCADTGRYVLLMGIFSYIIYRMFKEEFDR